MEEKITIIYTYLISFLIGMAVGVIIISFYGTKFCHECGRRYASRVEYCPIDGIELKEVAK